MPVLQNGQHELFAQKWHETDNKSEATRYAYPKSLKWKDESVHVEGCKISKIPKVLLRYQELKEETAQNHGITVDSLILELDAARRLAMQPENAQSSAAVSATMAKAKLVGLDITKIEVLSHETLTPWGAITAAVDE
jgi:hypothetical protein